MKQRFNEWVVSGAGFTVGAMIVYATLHALTHLFGAMIAQ